MNKVEAAAQVMEHLCIHDESHGYTQGSGRYGNGSEEEIQTCIGYVTIAAGDGDCASMVKRSIEAVGLPSGGMTYTGDEETCLLSAGWTEYAYGSVNLQRGDILHSRFANSGHTAMYLGNGLRGEAWINEHGTNLGGEEGDQTGDEVRICEMDNPSYNWQHVFRYELEDDMSAEDVWNFNQNGTLMRDRIQGTDQNTQAILAKLNDTSDPTGRGKEMTDHEHIKWIGAEVAELKKMVQQLLDK